MKNTFTNRKKTLHSLLHSAKGLIFDLDGTLTLTQQFHAKAFAEVFKKRSIKFTKADDLRYAGKGSHCIFPEFFAEHGIKITKKQTLEFAKEKKQAYDRIVNTARIKPVPGIKNFLKKMRREGKKMIVATGNKLESVEIILRKTGLYEFFIDETGQVAGPLIVTNQDVKKSKPAPDIFLKAAEKLGLKPKECVVFEDSPNGIQAAKAGKIPCIALATGLSEKELEKKGAKFVIKNYSVL